MMARKRAKDTKTAGGMNDKRLTEGVIQEGRKKGIERFRNRYDERR